MNLTSGQDSTALSSGDVKVGISTDIGKLNGNNKYLLIKVGCAAQSMITQVDRNGQTVKNEV